MKIRKRQGKNKATYYLDYRVNGYRRRESLGTITKRQAELIMAQRRKEVSEGNYPIIKDYKKISFFEICNEFLQWSRIHKRSFKRDEQFVKNLQAFFGNTPLYQLTRKRAEDYMAWRGSQQKRGNKPISKATVNKEIACLKRIFNKAIEWGKARDNPVSRIGMFRTEEKKPRFLSQEEFDRLMESACEPLRPIVLLAGFTGMRRGEILNLTWKNIKFDLGLIYAEHTKSNKAREIPMANKIKKLLWQLRKKSSSEYVFADKEGRPLKAAVRFWFDKAVINAKIPECTFHTLRHTFASNLVRCNINLKVIQELLGHCNLSVTMKYAHLSPGLKEQAIQMLNSEFGPGAKWSKKESGQSISKAKSSKVLKNTGEFEKGHKAETEEQRPFKPLVARSIRARLIKKDRQKPESAYK